MAKAKSKALLDLPVSFGGVSIGDETARVGFSVERERLSLENADAHLCGRRVTGWIQLTERNEHPDQGRLDGFGEPQRLEGTFDIKSIGVSRKSIHGGLTAAISEIKVEELALFAKRQGKLVIAESEEMPDENAGNGEE